MIIVNNSIGYDMVQGKESWWENRVLRSVDNLKLWQENPRLDPSSRLVKVRDYVEELISDVNDKQNFIDLITSIANRGLYHSIPLLCGKIITISIFMSLRVIGG